MALLPVRGMPSSRRSTFFSLDSDDLKICDTAPAGGSGHGETAEQTDVHHRHGADEEHATAPPLKYSMACAPDG
jgi:hypothetical protein